MRTQTSRRIEKQKEYVSKKTVESTRKYPQGIIFQDGEDRHLKLQDSA